MINTTDKDILQTNLSLFSLFIAVYENMVDYIEIKLEPFLCDEDILESALKAFKQVLGKEHNYHKKHAVECDVMYAVLGAVGVRV